MLPVAALQVQDVAKVAACKLLVVSATARPVARLLGLPTGQKAVRDGTYVGELLHGVADGYGRGDYVGGGRYEGQWAEDRPHGEGRWWFGDGSRYEGQFEAGQRHGYGRLVSADGTVSAEGVWWHGELWSGWSDFGPLVRVPPSGADGR